MAGWMEAGVEVGTAGEALGAVIVVIVISVIAIVGFAWIFRETEKRD